MRALLLMVALSAVGCGPKRAPESASDPRGAPAEDPFDGDWGGSLSLPGSGTLRLILHVRGAAATLDSLDQRIEGIPASRVERTGERIRITFPSVGGLLDARRDGLDLTGFWEQHGVKLHLKLTRDLVPELDGRPQDPALPLPYPTRALVVDAGEHKLACTLALPEGDGGPWPGVVLITGSGPQNRDEYLAGHRPFLVLSDHLARRGIASLRCDDRGYAASTGDHASATSADFAQDARASAAALRALPEVDRVGFIGHSEGGLIAPMAAEDADFLVLLAPPAVPGDALLITQIEAIAAADGVSGVRLEGIVETYATLIGHVVAGDVLDATLRRDLRYSLMALGVPQGAADARISELFGPWFRYFLTYDPAPALTALDVPTLALWGSTDLQVDATLNEAATRSANPAIDTRVFPGLNHLFQPSESGAPSDYGAIDTTVAPAVLQAVSDWILALDDE